MQGSSYAPLQFLRSPWNRDVYTAIDNQVDGRTVLVLYLGAASTLPSELQKYNIGCVLIHKDEKQIYLNTGNDTTPTWVAFGPGTNTLPTPFVAGQYLTNDGVDAFWSLIDLATGVTGLLDSDHIDLSDLANNSDFIDFLIANSYFTTSLANDTNFINTLTSNVNFQNAVNTFVSGSGTLQIDQTPDNGTFGLLAGDVDGINDTYTVSLGTYGSGKLQVYLNGLIQLQGASDDYIELVPGSGTFKFNTPPATNDVITVVYNTVTAGADNYTVKATTNDTTPDFLDGKINIHSSDSSVTVTKTITNPAGDEIVDYDLTTSGGLTIDNGSEFYFANYSVSGNPSFSSGALPNGNLWKFNDYLIIETDNYPSPNQTSKGYDVLKIDQTTGTYAKIAQPWTLSKTPLRIGNMFVDETQSKMYIEYVSVISSEDLIIDEFDSTFTNTNTYRFTGNIHSMYFGRNLLKIGSAFYSEVQQLLSGTISTLQTYRFDISGSTLINPTATNLPSLQQASWDGTNVWSLGAKYTVSGVTFTTVSATYPTLPPSSAVISGLDVYGIQIIDGKYCIWQPTGSYFNNTVYTGTLNNYTYGEIAQATLRQYPLP